MYMCTNHSAEDIKVKETNLKIDVQVGVFLNVHVPEN